MTDPKLSYVDLSRYGAQLSNIRAQLNGKRNNISTKRDLNQILQLYAQSKTVLKKINSLYIVYSPHGELFGQLLKQAETNKIKEPDWKQLETQYSNDLSWHSIEHVEALLNHIIDNIGQGYCHIYELKMLAG
ncbi:hypothetical protein KGF54_005282 [Candida jiufengensis]|uniref:uncharacterized protein n=1 Tax=Candida jiufengensis TaxID=497108 RepID=UPI00222574FF|nr:uncharacterized protein KGF54_005282 [Candida jiufengensis]KAI5950134.1 hypothetical protein KGF54_005282 [Candida jiufengensis]